MQLKIMDVTFIINQLIDKSPQIGWIATLIIFVAILSWKFSQFYSETKKNNGIIPNINQTLQKIDNDLNILNNDLKALNKVLVEKNIISQSYYSQENSPRIANELGQKLFEQSGAQTLFEKKGDQLVSELEQTTQINSLLELEHESLNLLLHKMDEPDFKPIQDFAFEHPTFDGKPLTYSDILFVISLMLRDAYRQKHPELDQQIASANQHSSQN